MSETDWMLIGGEWPALRHFVVKFDQGKWKNQDDFKRATDFISNHNQTKYLTLHHSNLYAIDSANMDLPHLQSLELVGLCKDYLSYHGQQVHFSNLRKLSLVMDSDNEKPEMLFFEQLEKLSLTLNQMTKWWMEFLRQKVNANLTSFSLFTANIDIDDLLNIPNILTSLNTVRISYPKHLHAINITNFIQKSGYLIDLDLDIFMVDSELDRLIDTLPEIWDFRIYPSDIEIGRMTILLER